MCGGISLFPRQKKLEKVGGERREKREERGKLLVIKHLSELEKKGVL